MNVNYDELIMLAGGAFLTVFGFGKINERGKLIKSGVKVEGIVFDIETSLGTGPDTQSTTYYPVIRFVTADKEWITEKYNIGSNPSVYSVGEKVTVIYDITDYKHFLIDNTQTKLFGAVLIAVGTLLILGVIMYFFINQYPSLS
ncbi:DUF3592 domain-containing protein [Mucilaginibacter xinganensis]|uniref:DUF3592 domain-containing protein n=1 Tax=Mucilaginibacter xinganensis TaxID=1234841 RepID=A0A223NX79_9SPHI|nr:DUF3592 domain-containing protein [Mucilaginibacter xinganensis]ASU34472.1 hypothetical protein MuYL_2585 [Mucilaginibacter xinganensis]